MSALSDLLMQHLPEGWSARRVAREAQKRGLTLKESTATAYFGSRHGAIPSEPVLQALAEVLDIPIEEVRQAAGLPVGEHLPYQPPAEAARLSQRQRAAIDELIRAVVGPTKETPHATEEQEPEQDPRSKTRGRAIRPGAPNTQGPGAFVPADQSVSSRVRPVTKDQPRVSGKRSPEDEPNAAFQALIDQRDAERAESKKPGRN